MHNSAREAASVAERMSQGALALYRKYRPSGFGELVGQQAVVQGLEAAVRSGRVAHAYLFAGPRGTGKTSAARIFAKCLDCQTNGPRPDPCGICDACTSIAAGTAFDVTEIDAASNNGVDDVRALRERVKFAPAQFRTKVYIIDEVHMLSSGAFNALLKTLEEPPDYVVFVLATTEPQKVPATILSRCQRYEFRRVTPADIAKRLEDVARLEKIGATPDAISRLSYLSDGSLRDALVLLEQSRGFSSGKTIDGVVLDAAFGASHRELVEGVVDAIASADPGSGLRAVADAVAVGADPAWLAKECVRWFRLALLALVDSELIASEVGPEDVKSVTERAAALGRSKVLTALRHLTECTASQRFSTQPRIDLELAVARIILPGDELSLRALSDRLHVLEERSDLAKPPPAPSSPPPKDPGETPARSGGRPPTAKSTQKRSAETIAVAGPAAARVSAARLSGLWPMILSAARERSIQAFGHLQHAAIADASDDLVTIGVDDRFNRDQLADTKMTSLVADAIAQASGSHPKVRFVLSETPSSKPAAHILPAAGLALAADVLGDDLI